ncbi:MAG: serine/threonine-protein kinase [Pseudomonadota bacterium]|nr:serine/threonine-protein kinase [Pseudomonadota bacterium]
MSRDDDTPVTRRLEEGSAAAVTRRMASPADVTQRMAGNESVTRRLDAAPDATQLVQQVTARLRDGAALMSVLQLQAGNQIADRYRVQAGPLGGISGEAEIYRCRDERTGTQVVVKLYRHNMAPRQDVLKGLLGLNHPDIVSIKDYGSWTGRFFEAMEYCEGGSMADVMPLSEQRLREYIGQIINGLNYCHRQGIIHRDIKPNNLFFRDAARKESVLGDFGISSILDPDNEGVRITQTAANLTLDYAAPELLDSHKVGPKTDYYSLGVTLIHLLLGYSPFRNMSNTDILVAHLRARIDHPQHLSPGFGQLLCGLLQISPDNRWGYRQVHTWLQGRAIVRDDGSAWREQQAPTPSVGYPGYPQAQTPPQLARALDHFDAARQLFRGDIRRWLFDHHDPALAERVEEIEENFTEDPQTGLQKLRFLLDPTLPLRIQQHDVYSPDDLLDLLMADDAAIKESIAQLLFGGSLLAWMDTLDKVNNRETLLEKVSLISEKLRYKDTDLALFALRCTLDPGQPLPLIRDISLPHPGQIEAVLRNKPQAKKALAQAVTKGYFEQWLRAAQFPGWEEDVSFIRNCRIVYAHEDALLTRAIRWHFQPDQPFPFAGKSISDARQLAALIDRDERSRNQGLKLLAGGWIRAWLVATGRLANPDALDQVLWSPQSSEESKLESVLQLMDPELPKPQLAVKFSRINFGRLDPAQPRSKTIVIRSTGRGHLSGDLRLQDYDRGFTIDNSVIEGNETVIRLTASSLGMPENSRHQTTLSISSNGGDHSINLAYQAPRQQRQHQLPDLQELLLTFFQHVNPRHLVTLGILLFFIINLTFCHDVSELPF